MLPAEVEVTHFYGTSRRRCNVETSVVESDPDSMGSLDPGSDSRSGSRRAKMTQKNIKQSSFEVLDFSFEG